MNIVGYVAIALAVIAIPSQGSAQQVAFQGQTASSAIEDASSATTPGAIHQWNFAVSGMLQPLTAVQVQLVLVHAALGDLSLVLIAPNGARLTLAAHTGALGGTNTSLVDLVGNYIFDDNGVDFWQAAADANGTLPQGASYRTSTEGRRNTGGCTTWLNLVFGGMLPADSNGVWRVETRDHRPSNTGGYIDAYLRLTQAVPLPDPIFASSYETELPRAEAIENTATPAVVQGGLPSCRRPPAYDLDGNGFSDYLTTTDTVAPNGDVLTWNYRLNFGDEVAATAHFVLGRLGDQFASGDYDGDGLWDAAIFRPGNPGMYLIRPSSNPGATRTVFYGTNGDARNVGDYDGDGVYDFAQYNVGSGPSSNGNFVVRDGRTGVERTIASTIFYTSRVIGGLDYTGDGIGDLVQRIGNVAQVRNGAIAFVGPPITLGLDADMLAPGQFRGDALADVTVTGAEYADPGERRWTALVGGTSDIYGATMGYVTGVPAPGDYDGDGIDDFANWEVAPNNDGIFRFLKSTNGFQRGTYIGTFGDRVPAAARVH